MTKHNEDISAHTSWTRRLRACLGDNERDRRNSRQFVAWTLLWGLSFTAAGKILDHTALAGPAAWALAMLPVVLGAVALLAYLRMLREADELMRKIQRDGLAFGFGAGLVFWIGNALLQHFAEAEADASDVLTVMLVGFSGGVLFSTWHYK